MSKACDSQESSGFSAALMPPAAALEWERTGWTLLMMATDDPAPAAAIAARWPASPAPMMRTSCAGMAGESISRTARIGVRRNGAPRGAPRLRRALRARGCAAAAALRAVGAGGHGEPRPAEDGEAEPGERQ